MKYRNIILYVLAIAAIGLLSTCSSNNDYDGDEPLSAYDLPIQFAVSSVDGMEVMTRSDESDTYNSSLPVGSEIGVYIYDSDGYDLSVSQPVKPSPSTTWVYQVSGSVGTDGFAPLRLTSHTKNPRFPLKEDSLSTDTEYKTNVKVFAVYPNNPDFKPSENTNNATSYDFTVNLAQDTEGNIKTSDLLASDQATYTSTDCESRLSLLMKHRMAKIKVAFTPKEGSDLTAANMPTAFDVLNVNRTVTITPTTGTIVTSTANSDKTTADAPLKGVTTESFFIPPQTVAAGTAMLKFNVLPNGEEDNFPTFLGINGCTFAPAANTTFEAGKQYLITVTVDVDFATMTGTITPWTNGGKIVYTAYEDSIM